jgi:hypothetical protein
VTLPRLLFAWLPVAAAFVIVGALAERRLPGPRAAVAWSAAEAGLLTLFASLWFDSLGHGEWWLLFALVGALVGLPRARTGGPHAWRGLAVDIARYVAAGGLLAWRLG